MAERFGLMKLENLDGLVASEAQAEDSGAAEEEVGMTKDRT